MRASVSTILTEQTLGRGLRLPFGAYSGIEILDTLEVLGRERYAELLKKAGVLNEEFVDYRTRLVLRENAEGQLVPVVETEQVSTDIAVSEDGTLPQPTGGVNTPAATTGNRERAMASALREARRWPDEQMPLGFPLRPFGGRRG